MGTNRNKLFANHAKVLTTQPIYPVIGQRKSKVNWPLCVDEKIAEILGILIHNGKVSRSEQFILVRGITKQPQVEQRLETLLYDLHLTLNTNSRQWSGLFRCITPAIYSAEFARTFLSLLDCDRLTQLMGLETIPECIKLSPRPIQQAFFVGYVSSCYTELKNKQLFIYPSMPSYKQELQDILNLLNIESTITKDSLYTTLGLE